MEARDGGKFVEAAREKVMAGRRRGLILDACNSGDAQHRETRISEDRCGPRSRQFIARLVISMCFGRSR